MTKRLDFKLFFGGISPHLKAQSQGSYLTGLL